MSNYIPLTDREMKRAQDFFKEVIVPTFGGGAVLNMRDPSNTLLLHTRGGSRSEREFKHIEMLANKQNYALEKFPHVVSTYQLRDQPGEYTTGAIRTPHDDRFSIHGFSWRENQNAALWLAHMLKRINAAQASVIAGLSGERQSFIEQHRRLSAALDEIPAGPTRAFL